MHLDLRTLRHFVALIDHGSFAAAAAAVNLSQSAFSRSIQNLEQQAGHLLVDRSARELPPTSQGRLVLDYARPLLRNVQALKQELDQFSAEESGTLSFGCGSALVSGLIPRALACFVERYPRAKVHYDVDSWQELDRRLKARDMEFCVADTPRFEVDPRYQVQRLLPQRWYFYCRQGHPLTAFETVDGQQLFSYPLATSRQLHGIGKVLTQYGDQGDFVPAVECENSQSLFDFIKLSNAVGILTEDARAAMTAQGAHVLTINDLASGLEECQTHYGIVTLRERPLSPLAKAFIEIIQQLDGQRTRRLLALTEFGSDLF